MVVDRFVIGWMRLHYAILTIVSKILENTQLNSVSVCTYTVTNSKVGFTLGSEMQATDNDILIVLQATETRRYD
jgi:hypothetical protein